MSRTTTDNAPCLRSEKKQTVKVDYKTYFPTRGGHVVSTTSIWEGECDEIDAGAESRSAMCIQ